MTLPPPYGLTSPPMDPSAMNPFAAPPAPSVVDPSLMPSFPSQQPDPMSLSSYSSASPSLGALPGAPPFLPPTDPFAPGGSLAPSSSGYGYQPSLAGPAPPVNVPPLPGDAAAAGAPYAVANSLNGIVHRSPSKLKRLATYVVYLLVVGGLAFLFFSRPNKPKDTYGPPSQQDRTARVNDGPDEIVLRFSKDQPTLKVKIDADVTETVAEQAPDGVVGDPLDAATQIGPVVDKGQLDQNLSYLSLAAEEGCDVRGGGLGS